MVTVFYRNYVYVDIGALNGCDAQHPTVLVQLIAGTLIPKVGT